MLLAKECSSVVNIGVVDQDLVYLLVDGLSGCGCISRREACHETDVVIDECLSGKSELAAVSLQLSLRELVIFEDVMLELSVLRYLVELADWSGYVVVVMLLEVLQGSLLCELIKGHGYLAVSFLVCLLDCLIEDCWEGCLWIVETSGHHCVKLIRASTVQIALAGSVSLQTLDGEVSD